MKNATTFIVLALFMLCSCQNKSSLKLFLDNTLNIDDFETILIIPINNSCDGCVREALKLQADYKFLVYSDPKDSLIFINENNIALDNTYFLKKSLLPEKDILDLTFPNRLIKEEKEITVQVLNASFFMN